ncbi:hypothetical protein [Halobacteriovorax sp. DPLXC-1]|uniref:hypothetical protein n=1 Tax=Halobacteriovorax sp. DPLXC-1 TaxID=3110771 RepID=UPI002FEE8E99
MELTKPSKCGLISSLIKHDIKESVYKLKLKLNINKRPYINTETITPPNSERVRKITKIATELYHPALFNHGIRSYAFGKLMMNILNEDVDDEVFFIGSLLHDLGLMRDCTNSTFEIVGAKEAVHICKEHYKEEELQKINEMIILHDAVGHAENKSKELKYLHYGAGIDVADLWTHRINPKNYDDIFKKYPSLNHIEVMIGMMKNRMLENPDMYLSTLIKLGFFDKMRNHKMAKKQDF